MIFYGARGRVLRVNSVYTYGIKNFGEKMAFLEQNRLKTGKKCRFRIYLRIYFGCFEVFWLEGKGFFVGNQIP